MVPDLVQKDPNAHVCSITFGVSALFVDMTYSGYALLSSDERSVFVSNLSDGVDQYAVPTFNRVKSFFHPVTKNPPLQVAAAFQNSWLLVGGEDGVARIFDRETGSLIQALEHEQGNVWHLHTVKTDSVF